MLANQTNQTLPARNEMASWPIKPTIYEINTWVWLHTLSQEYGYEINLDNVPDGVLDELADFGLDAVWMMGVWARSTQGRLQARQYVHEYRPALPDINPVVDIVGSPYAVQHYEVDEQFGGRAALASFREQLRTRGIRLILDYVPNHMAFDHPWIQQHPDYLIQGRSKDLKQRPSDFFSAQDAWGRPLIMAHGRDPYFPGWSDTVQVNALHPGFRQAIGAALLEMASQCDGLRCDMAMLLVNRIFKQTWRGYYDEDFVAQTEFWDDVIPPIKEQYPDFKFIAEVYWNMEFDMQQLGFDLTYDKMLYDRLVGGGPREVRVHLIADIAYQRRLVRFTENHDEPRAYTSLGAQKNRPAIVLAATLPGALLLHDGQFQGRRAKLPVHIGRAPNEPVDAELVAYYRKLLAELRAPIYQTGKWRMFNLFPAWSNNNSYDRLIAHGWSAGDEHRLIIVNLTGAQAQAVINLSPWPEMGGHQWRLRDVLNGDDYVRDGDQMVRPGLYIDLTPYQSHIFVFEKQ